MCGIAGVIDFAGAPPDTQSLTQACRVLAHRGPDDAGTWTGCLGRASVGLDAVRLAVQDLSPLGHQPMTRADGRFVLAYNGEIYNFRELRAELECAGETFRSGGDTEVVLAACARWGSDALRRFNGMWALAFFDTKDGTGFLSRDRFGIKPLLYRMVGDVLSFGSEMPVLDCLQRSSGRIDQTALLYYLRFGYIPDPHSIDAETHRLPPGGVLHISADGARQVERFYELPPAGAAGPGVDYSTACRRVRELTFSAVASRRVADVPIGAFLSGGLDSSVVVAHLASCSSDPVKTFAIGYAEHGAYDETNFARIVARRFGTDHHEYKLTHREILDSLLPIIDHLGEPFGDSSLLPTALVSRFARGKVTVALSGDGGDELFGGYWRYLGQASASAYARLPGWLRKAIIEPVLHLAPASKAGRLRNLTRQFRKLLRGQGGDFWQRHLAWSQILSPEAQAILMPEAQSFLRQSDPMLQRMRATAADEPEELNRILRFDLLCGLPGDMLHKVDLASMYHSLEVRVPFLDVRLVDEVVPLPVRFKIARGMRKRILTDAHRELLPEVILQRSKKGFEVPVGEYLRGPLRELYQATVTREAVESFGMLDYAELQRVYADHCAQRAEHADLLYAVFVLCRWRAHRP